MNSGTSLIIPARPQPKLGDVLTFLGNWYSNSVGIIGSKARGNYSAPFWFDNSSILLLEKQAPSISISSGFLGPVGPHIYGFKYGEHC